MHQTSLNVSQKLDGRLTEISAKFKISKRQLVGKIFMYCHHHLNFNILITGRLTGYQKKTKGDKWKCLRVDFSDAECDVYFEYRKMFRISLSKLLAVGFFLFFDLIVAELSGESKDTNEPIDDFLNSYTEIKQLLYDSIKDILAYFILKPEKEP